MLLKLYYGYKLLLRNDDKIMNMLFYLVSTFFVEAYSTFPPIPHWNMWGKYAFLYVLLSFLTV